MAISQTIWEILPLGKSHELNKSLIDSLMNQPRAFIGFTEKLSQEIIFSWVIYNINPDTRTKTLLDIF